MYRYEWCLAVGWVIHMCGSHVAFSVSFNAQLDGKEHIDIFSQIRVLIEQIDGLGGHCR
jgi:hypothetical protein